MSRLPFDLVIDRCVDDIAAGRRTVAECLEAYAEHRAELEPLLVAAFAVHELPRVETRPPDPARRAAFMAELQRTPQIARSRWPRLAVPALPALPTLSLPSLGGGLGRMATVAAPAMAVAVVAVLLVLAGGATPASASTLTVFAGGVEMQGEGGAWETVADGASLAEGVTLRTSDRGRALITFLDGSTAALSPSTELVLDRVRLDGEREIRILQRSGRLWNDVVSADTEGGSYVVVTPDARVEVHGTVFETAIPEPGATEVATAEGLVEVRAGDEVVRVAPGQLVRAMAQHISERRDLASERGGVKVEAPFTASLVATDGAATGARPDGVTFRQLAGVTTSDPGEGPQRIDLQRADPGEYTLVLRRFDEGSGNLVIETPGGTHTVEVDDQAARVTLHVEVERDDDGRLAVRVVGDGDDGRVSPVRPRDDDNPGRANGRDDNPGRGNNAGRDDDGDDDEVRERVVETRRSERAVDVAERRRADRGTATATATANDDDDDDDDDRSARPTPAARDAAQALRTQLNAIRGDDADALARGWVAEVVARRAELGDDDFSALVREGVARRAVADAVRALLVDGGGLDEAGRAALREHLPPGFRASGGPGDGDGDRGGEDRRPGGAGDDESYGGNGSDQGGAGRPGDDDDDDDDDDDRGGRGGSSGR